MKRFFTLCVLVSVIAAPIDASAWAGACPSGWVKSTLPVPGTMYGAASTSPDDVWLAGFSFRSWQAKATHWNGSSWAEVPVVVDSGSVRDRIRGVDALNENDVWFVGDYAELGTETNRALVLRWTGAEFEQMPIDAGSDAQFFAVDAVAGDDVWAVGTVWPGGGQHGLAAHWDGSEWELTPVPHRPGAGRLLYGVAAVAADDVWAVGVTYDRKAHPYIAHWDGSSWTTVKGADVGTGAAGLYGITDAGSTLVAVGDRANGDRALVETWTGSSWVRQPVPRTGAFAGFTSVDGTADDRIWAVGYSGLGPLSMRWDGVSWTSEPTGLSSANQMVAVTTLPTGETFASGLKAQVPFALSRCDLV